MNYHNLMNYIIGFAALFLVIGVAVDERSGTSNLDDHVHRLDFALDFAVNHATPVASHNAWTSLTSDQTIALGEAIKALNYDDGVTLYCSTIECVTLRNDLDDAFQIAGWSTDFESREVESESDLGVAVGPPGKTANKLATIIVNKTGLPVSVVDIDLKQGLGVIIGKKPK
jgi:hypothetical protein